MSGKVMNSARRRFLISAVGTATAATLSSDTVAQGAVLDSLKLDRSRELRSIVEQAANLKLGGTRSFLIGSMNLLDYSELINNAVEKGPDNDDAVNFAVRTGLYLGETTRNLRDGNQGPPQRGDKRYEYNDLKKEYLELFQKAKIKQGAEPTLSKAVNLIMSKKARYKEVEAISGVPWFVVAALHYREAWPPLALTGHLHNGDPVQLQTTHVPAKRPPRPWPPSGVDINDLAKLWMLSAKDALSEFSQNHNITNWAFLQRMCFGMESYNGMGYRAHKIKSAYLWGYTQWYTAGGYPSDGVFDPNWQSKQLGTIPIIMNLRELDKEIQLPIEA